MAISPELRRLYASAPYNSVFKQTLQLYHPAFTQQYYLTNYPEAVTGVSLGTLPPDVPADPTFTEFMPWPFKAVEPDNDARGQQDLRLALANVDPTIMDELQRAATSGSTRPIDCLYRVYIDDDPDPNPDPPLYLFLSAIEANYTQISATATRADVVNAEFPRVFYTISGFPALQR